MLKFLFSLVAIVAMSFSTLAQIFLGESTMSPLSTEIPAPEYMGEIGAFEGGYVIDDQVANFQAYNANGDVIRLSDFLDNGKYTILMSGSITCERFVDSWNTDPPDNAYLIFQDFVNDHLDDFNWLNIYTFEAHPGDTSNCMSNCPPEAITAPTGDTIYQHQTYADRLEALSLWRDIVDSPSMTYDMPVPIVADNPDNRLLSNFFERPNGIVVVDCSGVVVNRGDWAPLWMVAEGGIEFLEEILEDPMVCEAGPFSCLEGDTDYDNDGICDQQELWQGWDMNDPNSPGEATSISEVANQNIRCFPNPFRENLWLQGLPDQWVAQVYDLSGKLLMEFRGASENLNLDTSLLAEGMYILTVQDVERQSFSSMQIQKF